MASHKDMETLNAGMPDIRQAPDDNGVLELIVARPAAGDRVVVEEGRLTTQAGLEGDNWRQRMVGRDTEAEPATDNQVTLMNIRVVRLLDDDSERWPLAGDQLYVDLSLSDENLPPGQRVQIGEAVLEVSALPHTGCKMFAERFGVDAMRFVNSEEGKRLHLRGINARVVQEGAIRTGDRVVKV
jgi:hypothetical protein